MGMAFWILDGLGLLPMGIYVSMHRLEVWIRLGLGVIRETFENIYKLGTIVARRWVLCMHAL